jgi:hypothetical protein
MPSVSGTVDRISVFPQFCCVTIRSTATQQRVMLLWSYFSQEDNATNRLLHGGYLAMVRDAFVHNRKVEFLHPSGSALVDSVALVQI